ncbi:MAG: hypothetical protein AAF989_13665, partial [Planctomycetota bacterium]
EDEAKRVRLLYDDSVTTPSVFRSGGYQEARTRLTVLAMLFAVVSEYDGEIRWKKDARAARDVCARTARNSQSGTIQVFNEAKQRKADLQDLMSGASIAARGDETANDWSIIADRVPLMTYAEEVLDALSDLTRDAATTEGDADVIVQYADMLAILGVALQQDGMDDSDDPDYAALSKAMTDASAGVKDAVRSERWGDLRTEVGKVSQSCVTCHDDYR